MTKVLIWDFDGVIANSFEQATLEQGKPTPTETSSGQGGDSDDNEPDCCPGVDDPTSTPTPKIGKVATAAIGPQVQCLKSLPSSGFNPLPLLSSIAIDIGLAVRRIQTK